MVGKRKSPKIREIKSSLKIIQKEKEESLEEEIEEADSQRLASFVSNSTAPVLRRSNAVQEIEEIDTPRTATSPNTDIRSTPLYTPRSSSYTPGSANFSAASNTGEGRMYEDPMVAATRRIRQQTNPTMLEEQRSISTITEPSLGLRGSRDQGIVSDQRIKDYADSQDQKETREKKRRYAWES